MFKKSKGFAPLIIILLIALGLIGGTVAGYEFREPIKKAISGVTTAEEIQKAIDTFKLGQSKFELEGITISVDATNQIINVKIKSSTASIKEMRLSETPITLSGSVSITFGEQKNLKITDIPIDAQVHVGGTILEGVLTTTTVIIQKEDADENSLGQKTKFSVGGAVKTVGTDNLVVTVSTANKLAKDQKSKDLTIKTDAGTVIEKANSVITLSDIKAGDNVQVTGSIVNTEYIASKIEVKVKEQAGELEEEQNTNQNQGNSTKNKETETEKNVNSNSNSSSNANPNANSDSNKNN